MDLPVLAKDAATAFITVWVLTIALKQLAQKRYDLQAAIYGAAGGPCQELEITVDQFDTLRIGCAAPVADAGPLIDMDPCIRGLVMLQAVMWITAKWTREHDRKVVWPATLTMPSTPVNAKTWQPPIIIGIHQKSPTLMAVLCSRKQTEAMIVIRGSSTLYDWLDVDFKFAQTPFSFKTIGGNTLRMRVHSGYLKLFKTLLPQVLDAFKSLGVQPGATICVAGHSLGAAVANVFAMYLANTLEATVVLDSFAPPRAGDSAFSKAFTTAPISAGNARRMPLVQGYQYMNTVDVVPTMPPGISPNNSCPGKPWIYQQPVLAHPFGNFLFTTPRSTLALNHSNATYFNALNSIFIAPEEDASAQEALTTRNVLFDQHVVSASDILMAPVVPTSNNDARFSPPRAGGTG